jgi:hypothetical protein
MMNRNSQKSTGSVFSFGTALGTRVVKIRGNLDAAGDTQLFFCDGSSGKVKGDISIFNEEITPTMPRLARINRVIRSLEGNLSKRNALV